MSQDLVIPELGESITEAQIVQWRKKEGDRVEEDEIIADLETDKATLELPSTIAGVIESILKEEGATVQVGEAIARISEKAAPASEGDGTSEAKAEGDEIGEEAAESTPGKTSPPKKSPQRKEPVASYRRNLKADPAQEVEKSPKQAADAKSDESTESECEGLELVEGEPVKAPSVDTTPRLMPAAKEALEEYGIAPEQVEGSGPAGRILPRDVRRAAQGASTSEHGDEEHVTTMSRLHQQDAAAILDAWNTIPQTGVAEEIELRELDKLLADATDDVLGHDDADLHLTAFVAATILHLLDRFPELNAEVRGIELVRKPACHLSVLMNTEAGSVAPVIRNAERMTAISLSQALHELRQRALIGELSPDDLDGGTLTLESTYVGRVLYSIPSVRLGESAAFSINAIRQRSEDGRADTTASRRVIVSMAYDQRILSAERAEAALHALKAAMEHPVTSILTR